MKKQGKVRITAPNGRNKGVGGKVGTRSETHKGTLPPAKAKKDGGTAPIERGYRANYSPKRAMKG